MAVSVVGAARKELNEVHLERLGEEGIVARTEDPPGPRLRGVTGMRDRSVVGDRAGAPDAVGLVLAAAEFREAVVLRGDPAQEDAAFAVAHGRLIPMGGRMV